MASPSATRIEATFPAFSTTTGISIFMDSINTTVSPSATFCPTATSIFQTDPLTSDFAASLAIVLSSSSDAARNQPGVDDLFRKPADVQSPNCCRQLALTAGKVNTA